MAQQLVTVSNLPMLECDSEALLLQDGYRQVSSYKDRDDISRDLHISQHSNLVRFFLRQEGGPRDHKEPTLCYRDMGAMAMYRWILAVG